MRLFCKFSEGNTLGSPLAKGKKVGFPSSRGSVSELDQQARSVSEGSNKVNHTWNLELTGT